MDLFNEVKCLDLKAFRDERGELCYLEFLRDLPFTPLRFFTVRESPEGTARGKHAHQRCHQFLICAQGSCEVRLRSESAERIVRLEHHLAGLYIPPRVWVEYELAGPQSVLLVFASEYYSRKEYISVSP